MANGVVLKDPPGSSRSRVAAETSEQSELNPTPSANLS